MAAERLQKILAAAGIASRRKAEELIAEGHVSVNGQTVTELGTKADARMDEIRVDGELIGRPERHVYFMLYKPKGYVTTLADPEGRQTITDLLNGIKERVFPVGRLDYMSEGLLLLTNDGELMAQLTAAKTHVPKTYMVKVSGHPTEEQIDRLRAGINLPPEPGLTGARGKKQPGVSRRSFAVRTQPAEIDLVREQENPWYQVTLIEGRNRQIRRMFEEIGFHIEKIKRIRYGTLELNVEPGEWRQLTFGEINELRKSLAKPYRIKVPRKREDGQEDRRERRPLKAARRGFPKPKREDREQRFERRPRREAADAGQPADRREFRERAPRNEFNERPPRKQFGDRPRPDFRDRAERPAFRDRSDRQGAREDRGARPPRREFSDRPRKDFGDRPPRRDGERRDFTARDKRRSFGPGKPEKRFDREGRDERQEGGARPPRREFGARPPRREFGDRPPRRDFGDRPPRKEFGDRPPRRDSRDRDQRGERPPRREFGARDDRPRADRPKFGGPRSGGSKFGGPRNSGGRSGSRGGRPGSRDRFRRD